MSTAQTKQNAISRPRRPRRANGVQKFDLLVDTVEKLLISEGVEALSIQKISEAADIPKASVYHFFPEHQPQPVSPWQSDISLFCSILSVRPVVNAESHELRRICNCSIEPNGRFFMVPGHTLGKLILGSDYSWQVHQADQANNTNLKNAVANDVAQAILVFEITSENEAGYFSRHNDRRGHSDDLSGRAWRDHRELSRRISSRDHRATCMRLGCSLT